MKEIYVFETETHRLLVINFNSKSPDKIEDRLRLPDTSRLFFLEQFNWRKL